MELVFLHLVYFMFSLTMPNAERFHFHIFLFGASSTKFNCISYFSFVYLFILINQESLILGANFKVNSGTWICCWDYNPTKKLWSSWTQLPIKLLHSYLDVVMKIHVLQWSLFSWHITWHLWGVTRCCCYLVKKIDSMGIHRVGPTLSKVFWSSWKYM